MLPHSDCASNFLQIMSKTLQLTAVLCFPSLADPPTYMKERLAYLPIG